MRLSAFAAGIIAALVLFFSVGLPLLRRAGTGPGAAGATLPPCSFSAVGIDISHNNAGPIVWDSLRVMVDRSGRTVESLESAARVLPVRFVFIKATEGAGMRDPRFREYWAAAGERELQRGAYHFFRSSKDGVTQARHYIATVGELRHSDLPPVLDIETIHRGCSRKLLNQRVLQWLETIGEHYSRTPIIYTSDSFAARMLDSDITSNYPVWIAHYGVDSPDFDDWAYWQFTDRAIVHGLPEPVDLSLRR